MGAKAYSIDEIAARLAPLFEEKALQIVLLFGSQSSGKGHPERHAPPDDYLKALAGRENMESSRLPSQKSLPFSRP